MDNGKISVRYARALLNTARQQQCETEVYDALVRFTNNYGLAIGQFNEVLNNPIIESSDKIQLLKTAIGEPIPELLEQFLCFVAEQKRENKIYTIALKYQEMYREEKDILRTEVTTATELPEGSLRKIKGFVEQSFDCTAELHTKVDPSLIGGFVLDIENDRMDASVAGQLNALKNRLK